MAIQSDTPVTPGNDGEGVIKPRLHHLFIKTSRLDEMKEWYGVVLGLTPNFEWEAGAFMSNDDANHRIVFFSIPPITDDPDKVTHAGMHHVAFEYDTCDDLFSTYERLKQRGIEPHACLDHGLTTSFYYLDPDGNSLELQYDNFDDWAGSTEFMRNAPEFAEDPIGKMIDPVALVAARADGESMEEIHRRAYAGEMAPAAPYDIRLPL